MTLVVADMKLIRARARGCCEACGIWTCDHSSSIAYRRRARWCGGSASSLVNGLLLCGGALTGCRGRIESRRDPRDEAKGYWVRANQTPALTEVWLVTEFGSRWVWLTEDGDYTESDPADGTLSL